MYYLLQISQIRDILELNFFRVIVHCRAQRDRDPSSRPVKVVKNAKMNVHLSISPNLPYSSNELLSWNILNVILQIR